MAAGSGSDPEAIQREIEQTRQELSETLDAIAEKVSPKRAANRGAEKVKAGAKDAYAQIRTQLTAPGELATRAEPGAPYPGGAAGAYAYGGERVVRWDRVAIVGGVLTLLVFLSARRRRKRSRDRAS